MPRTLASTFLTELDKDVSSPVFLLEFFHGSYEYHYWTGSATTGGYVSDGAILDLPEFNETFGLQANDFRIKVAFRKKWTDKDGNEREIDLSDISSYRGKGIKLLMNFAQDTSQFNTNPSTDALTLFEGTITDVSCYLDSEESYFEIKSESDLVTLNTNKITRYSNQDQQARFSGDKGLEYARQAQNSLFIQRGETTPDNLYPRKIVYGEHKVDGDCVFSSISGDNGEFLNLVFAFADHEIESYEMLYLDDRQVWETGTTTYHDNFNPTGSLQLVTAYTKTGADNQTSISELTTEVGSDIWSTNHRLRGIAYVYIRCQYQTNIFGDEIPKCSALIKGKKVYDPRTSTTAYSDNPALCLRDFLLNDRYGLGTTLTSDTHFNTASNECDELLDITFGNETIREKRFACSAVLSSESTPADNINRLLSAFHGSIVYSSGKFHVYAGVYTPSSRVVTLDDVYGDITSYNTNYRNVFNKALGTYIDPESDYRRDEYPPFELSSYEESDERRLTLDFESVNNTRQCQRLAKIAVKESRQTKVVSFSTNLHMLTATAGDTIDISTEQDSVDGLYKIQNLSLQFNPIQVKVVAKKTSAQDYTFDDNEYTEKVIPATEPASNIIEWVNAKLPSPTFSRASSNFYEDFSLEILFDSANHTCFFTTDGSLPTINASNQPQGTTQTYSSAITISSSTDGEVKTVKAFVIQTSGSLQSFVSTVSYTYVAPTTRLSRPIGKPLALNHVELNTGWRITGSYGSINPDGLKYAFKIPTMPAGSEFDNARSGLTLNHSFDGDSFTQTTGKSEGDIVTVDVASSGDSLSTISRKAQALTSFLSKSQYISSAQTRAYQEPFLFFGLTTRTRNSGYPFNRDYIDSYAFRPWSISSGTLYWQNMRWMNGFAQVNKGSGYFTDHDLLECISVSGSGTYAHTFRFYLVDSSGYTSPTYKLRVSCGTVFISSTGFSSLYGLSSLPTIGVISVS